MHVNFLHPFFESRVDCDVVTSDGYSVTNLISLDFRERSRGFLAAHFIKPPAILLFQLPFPVHVESMVINPKVGSQISSGIAILVAGTANKHASARKRDQKTAPSSRTRKKSAKTDILLADSNKVEATNQKLNASSTFITDAPVFNHSYEFEVTPSTVKNDHAHLFTQVAWVSDSEGKTFHLYNKMFQERRPVQGFQHVGMSNVERREFQRLYSLHNVTHVALKIARLSGSSVPAVGKVEIWGQPSAHCKPEILEYVLGIQERIYSIVDIKAGCNNEKHNRTGEGSNIKPVLEHGSDSIPEEFIDPITCEIMTVPLLLPSGHNIDAETLQKHITVERTWGRLPSDPFTGKVFSDTCKPVPNSALKVRIDKFLLISGLNTSGCGRTVGKDKILSKESNPDNRSLLKVNGKGRSHEEPYRSVDHERKEFKSGQELSAQKCPENILNSGLLTSENKEALVELGHEEAVSRSLDSAVHQTLQGLEVFTRKKKDDYEKPALIQASITQSNTDLKESRKRTAPQASRTLTHTIKKKSMVLCASCGRDLSKESIFHLPCEHVLCRSCLLTVTQHKDSEHECYMCRSKFKHMDVVRVHNK